jgi:ABC-type polysaccharide/polyol phosphate transport system ATPase subunit
MSKPVIQVENLSKMYRISVGAKAEYKTLRESISDAMTRPFRRRADGSSKSGGGEEVWALNDVSFDVRPGEVLGVIGRNGAGKSTLLKLLSQITQPTRGRIEMRGRVGSLLEVGTGFHPELTGRENIYLNGAILGMTRREIRAKFDEITAFAEIDRYLDTPVKRYSSGMYMRLAFAVASHLEPEILIVDEVLAVGDAQFQKKCLGRMSAVSREGRTVLFVSHNMSAIKSLCGRAILVETRILSVRLTDLAGNDVNQLYFGQPFRIGMTCDVLTPIEDAHLEISISTIDGTHVTYSSNTDGGVEPLVLAPGRHEIWTELHTVLLPRNYTIDVGIHHHRNGSTSDYVQRTLDFSVLRVAESGKDHYPWPSTRGLVRASSRWQVVSAEVPSAAEAR